MLQRTEILLYLPIEANQNTADTTTLQETIQKTHFANGHDILIFFSSSSPIINTMEITLWITLF